MLPKTLAQKDITIKLHPRYPLVQTYLAVYKGKSLDIKVLTSGQKRCVQRAFAKEAAQYKKEEDEEDKEDKEDKEEEEEEEDEVEEEKEEEEDGEEQDEEEGTEEEENKAKGPPETPKKVVNKPAVVQRLPQKHDPADAKSWTDVYRRKYKR